MDCDVYESMHVHFNWMLLHRTLSYHPSKLVTVSKDTQGEVLPYSLQVQQPQHCPELWEHAAGLCEGCLAGTVSKPPCLCALWEHAEACSEIQQQIQVEPYCLLPQSMLFHEMYMGNAFKERFNSVPDNQSAMLLQDGLGGAALCAIFWQGAGYKL